MRLTQAVTSLILLTVPFAVEVSAAEITVSIRNETKWAFVNIIGPIEKGDDKIFRDVALGAIAGGNIIYIVNTFSPGGDIETAMEIGRQIRTLGAITKAPSQFNNKSKGLSNCWRFSKKVLS